MKQKIHIKHLTILNKKKKKKPLTKERDKCTKREKMTERQKNHDPS